MPILRQILMLFSGISWGFNKTIKLRKERNNEKSVVFTHRRFDG
jgi:hypothetical protein